MDAVVEEDPRILSKFHSISSTLSELLENTFLACHAVEVERGAGCPPTPPPTKLKRRLLMYKTIKLPGIAKEEFVNDPVILVALNRIVNLLKENVVSSQQRSIDLSLSSKQLYPPPRGVEADKVDRGLLEIGQLSSYTWEQLNVGHWKNVPRFWRKLYTCLQILKVPFMILKGYPIPEILRECDMGLLMGEPIGDNVLSQIAEELCAKVIMDESPSSPSTSPSKMIVHQYEAAEEESLPPNYPPPLKNSSQNRHPVHVMDNPSLSEFSGLMRGSGTPCLLRNTVNHWPALHKWNVDFLGKFFGFRSVPVEIGERYTSVDWTQKIMTINEFIEKYMGVKKGRVEDEADGRIIAYIAQHTLFDQLPKLGEDIKIPDYCTLGVEGLSSLEINGWLGPAGTVSPCHYDPKHNILVQVFGSKAIRLFPPHCRDKLRPHKEGSLLFNTSQLDVEDDKLFDKLPEMQHVDCIDLILRKGEALYMPPKWWHYVRSLEPSFSVSFWFN